MNKENKAKTRFFEAFKNVTGTNIKPINENSGSNAGFTTDKIKVAFHNIEDWDQFKIILAKYPDAKEWDIHTSTSKVNWLGEANIRPWGIEGISVAITGIYFVAIVKFYNSNTDLIDEEQLVFDSSKMEDFTPTIQIGEKKITDTIVPELTEVDFKTKHIRVQF